MSDFRVRLETKDGQLVQNRHSDPRNWFFYGKPDMQMGKIFLERDCCEKGVRLVSFQINKDGVVGVVEWLK